MTTTKVGLAPFSTTVYTNPKGLTSTATPTATFASGTTAGWTLLDSFKLFVAGQSEATEEPTKSMTKWSTDTAATRKTAGVDASTNVSSFAIVVDLTTK